MSVREFAAHLGVSDRMVSKWEAGGREIRPHPVNQAALDESLRRCDDEEVRRFMDLQGLGQVRLSLVVELPAGDVDLSGAIVEGVNAVVRDVLGRPPADSKEVAG